MERLAQLVVYDDFRIGNWIRRHPRLRRTNSGERRTTSTVCNHLLTQGRVPIRGSIRSRWERRRSGAVGQHAPGRAHQPRRDDAVQPLRGREPSRFLHRVVAGLVPADLGIDDLTAASPAGGPPLALAKITTTFFGDASVAWRRNEATLELHATVPEATATSMLNWCPIKEPHPYGTRTWNLPSGSRRPCRPRHGHTPFDEIASDAV